MDNQNERATAGALRSITRPAPGGWSSSTMEGYSPRRGKLRCQTYGSRTSPSPSRLARPWHMNLVLKGWGQFARTVLHLKIPQRRPKDTSTFSMTNHPKSPTAMGKGRKRQVEDVTRSRGLDPACRRLRTLVAWLSTRRRRHH